MFDLVGRWLVKPGRFRCAHGCRSATPVGLSRRPALIIAETFHVSFDWNCGLATILMTAALGICRAANAGHVPLKRVFVPLANDVNAVLLAPVKPRARHGSFAILIARSDHINTFNYFIGPELARRGFQVMMVNYHGPEQVFDEFVQPLADAVRYLRKVPGIRYVVLAGHSLGGPELTYYQDVAESGPSARQGPERVYPCSGGDLNNLPPAPRRRNHVARQQWRRDRAPHGAESLRRERSQTAVSSA